MMPFRKISVLALAGALLRGVQLTQAQIQTEATCVPRFGFLNNSLDQSPCFIAAYLGSVCSGGVYDMPQLFTGEFYLGPSPQYIDDCQCSTVMYSMVAACSICQDFTDFLSWTAWSENCITTFEGSYPREIPPETAIPAYAFSNVVTANTFNVQDARTDASPESTGNQGIGTQTGSSNNPSDTGSPVGGSSNGNGGDGGGDGPSVGAIAGGVVAALVALVGIGVLTFFLVRRSKRRSAMAAGSPGLGGSPGMGANAGLVGMGAGVGTGGQYGDVGGYGQAYDPGTSPQMSSVDHFGAAPRPWAGPHDSTPSLQQRLYDPNDPTTFPTTPAPNDIRVQNTASSVPSFSSTTPLVPNTSVNGPSGPVTPAWGGGGGVVGPGGYTGRAEV